MTRLRKQKTSIVSLSVLFVVATTGVATAKPLIASLRIDPGLTQVLGTLTFPPPTTVPVGTKIRIGGSSSMEAINQVLKQRFEQQFVGTKVELNTQGTGPAIKDLLDGNADLAAIGRALTEQEKAQGLVSVPVSRHKIAIIVGAENPFKNSLTFEQFAKIFRGELKDWSQIGGAFGAIRFIDRPNNSDTRQAFRNYPVFKRVPFVTGTTAKQLAQDSTDQVVQALGKDGIGYAIADQLQGRGDVRVVPMHKTLPSNPKYPFSQPLVYVYRGPQPNPSAQAFLGYATAPASRQTIETARKEATTTAPSKPKLASPRPKVTASGTPTVSRTPIVSPSAPAKPQAALPSPNGADGAIAVPDQTVSGGLWLMGLPLLGGVFWWLLKRRDAPFESEDDDLPEATVGATGMETIAPDPVVFAEEPPPTFTGNVPLVNDEAKRGGAAWASGTLAGETIPTASELSRSTVAGDRGQFPLDADASRMISDGSNGAALAGSSDVAAMSLLAGVAVDGKVRDRPPDRTLTDYSVSHSNVYYGSEPISQSRIILIPRAAQEAYVYWEVDQAEKDALKHQGGQQLVLRVYEALGEGMPPASSVQQFSCNEWDQDQHVPIPVNNLDYVAELGYTTLDGRFLRLARSSHARVPGA